MSEPNLPKPGNSNNKPNPPANIDSVQFNSAMTAKVSQPQDYFAEQNQERAEKKRKFSQVRNKVLLIGGLLALIIVVTVTVLIILRPWNSGPTISNGDGQDGSDSELAGAEDLSEQVTEVFKPTYTVGEDGNIVVGGNLEEAEATFEAALNNPANKDRLDTIYLSQMIFYSSLSNNQRVVEIAEKVKPDKLNLSEKIKFYNLTYLAYAALGDKDQTNRYYNLMREAANKVQGIGG